MFLIFDSFELGNFGYDLNIRIWFAGPWGYVLAF